MWLDSLKTEVFMKDFELKTLFPKTYTFSTPRAGARAFVELDDFETLAAIGASQALSIFFRNSFSPLVVATSAEPYGCAFRAPLARHHGTTRPDEAEGLLGSQERGLALRTTIWTEQITVTGLLFST